MRFLLENKRAVTAVLILLLLVSISMSFPFAAPTGETYDYVIKNGRIMNPSTGHDLKGYSLAVKNGRIARISKEDMKAKRTIDAAGLVVSPGFIDLISYEPTPTGIKLKVYDGVTSNLLMHGGTDNAKNWYAGKKKQGQVVNYGASSFVTLMRRKYVGGSVDAVMTSDRQISQLAQDVRNNIRNGALGVSFSFEYIPGIKQKEVLALLEVAKENNVPSFYHLRYSSLNPPDNGPAGIREVLGYAKSTGASIHIMHINSTGGTGYMEEALKMCEDARREGLDVSADTYSYNSWATYLGSARFRAGWQERFGITYKDLQIGGTDTFITKDTFRAYQQKNVLVYAHNSIPEKDIELALQDPSVMVGSDTIISSGNNHPRGAGNYAKLFADYVRDKKVISLMQAIEKSAYLPARRLEQASPAMKKKGRLEVGCDADIILFNPATIKDKATVKNVFAPSVGVEYVFVNGVLVKEGDRYYPNLKPGKAIVSYFVDPEEKEASRSFDVYLDGKQVSSGFKHILGKHAMVPLSLLKQLEIEVKDTLDGDIVINRDIRLKIGSTAASIASSEKTLVHEPILYKGAVYIDIADMHWVLASIYKVSLQSDKILLEHEGE